MRLSLLFLLLCPALALADLPQLTTDVLAPGEKALGLSFSRLERTQDSDMVLYGLGPFPADITSDATAESGNWSYGADPGLEVGLNVSHMSSESTTTVHAVNRVQYRSDTAGWSDLFAYARWRIAESTQSALALQASAVVPTASDAHAVPETRVNGNVVPPASKDGGLGNGYSLFTFVLLGSHRMGDNAVEGSLEWHTDDAHLSDDDFAAGGRLVHFNGTQRYWLGLDSLLLGASHTRGVQYDSSTALQWSAGLALRPKRDMEWTLSASQTRYEDLSVVYPKTGSSADLYNSERLYFGAGIRMLMP